MLNNIQGRPRRHQAKPALMFAPPARRFMPFGAGFDAGRRAGRLASGDSARQAFAPNYTVTCRRNELPGAYIGAVSARRPTGPSLAPPRLAKAAAAARRVARPLPAKYLSHSRADKRTQARRGVEP